MEEEEEEKPVCPECGGWLSCERFCDKNTGEIKIEFWCDGAGMNLTS